MPDIKKNCRITGQEFLITEKDQKFYKRIDVPLPTLCPEERLRRRLLERNTRNLYYRKCDFSGEKIISTHRPDAVFPVYDQSIWWSNKWDASKYNQSYDFNRSFFEQLHELKNKVPHMSVFVLGTTMENSIFTNCTGYLKNCYMIFEADYDEDCFFSNRVYHSKNILDCTIVYSCELCYECIDCLNCQRSIFLQECENCQDCLFLRKCIGCNDCIGCINQRHKKHMIFNKQYSPSEYEQKKSSFLLNSYKGIQSFKIECGKFFQNQIYPAVEMERCENCTGDHLYDSKNCVECFDSKDLEDCKYCVKLFNHVKDSMDYTCWGSKAELIYECAACGDGIYNLKFCSTCATNFSDCQYCFECASSKNLFGCIGLQHKEYCIFNKQYSREEYEEMVPRIIKHMGESYGEFFPYSLCPFAYNESVVMDHFPLNKEQALAAGFRWQDQDKKEFQNHKVEIPDTIDNINEDFCEKILNCEETGKNYKIIPEELKFYKKMNLPIPHFCPDQRHFNRTAKRNPWKLYDRKCAKTGIPIKTTFAPDRPEIIYSKEAYLEEIY